MSLDPDDIIGVSATPLEPGFLFIGPWGRDSVWAPMGELSSALQAVVDRNVTAHPWDGWPNPHESGAKGLRTLEDGVARTELDRLSAAKLDEPWTDRPAQKQVLSNILHGREVSSAARKSIATLMKGRPLRELAAVVAEVLPRSTPTKGGTT